MPKADSELLVITKMYDLVIWSNNHIIKFPRAHRFTLGDRLAERLARILEMLIRCRYKAERAAILHEVNLELELLRFQFRMAKDMKCLPVESYGSATRAVNEVGRLVGSWIKKLGAKPFAGEGGRA
jgi:hypothetical protein